MPLRWTLLLLAIAPLWGQEVAGDRDSRLINFPGPGTVGMTTLEVIFTHRFVQTVADAGGENLWGLDSPADVGFGLALGLGRRGQVEIYRSSFFQNLELAGKVVVRPAEVGKLGVSLRAGGNFRNAFKVSPRWAGFFQSVLSWRPAIGWELVAVPTYVSDTFALRWAANVGFGAAVDFLRRWRLAAEVVPPNDAYPLSRWAWALALTKGVPGHSFSLVLGNSRATTTDAWVGGDFPGGLRERDVRLGFNLIRRFPE